MRYSFLGFFLLPVILQAQVTETYYDGNWKPVTAEKALYLSVVEKKDSGWYRKDFYLYNRQVVRQGLYKDSACKKLAGTVIQYYATGQMSAFEQKGKDGDLLMRYHTNGVLGDSGYFKNRRQTGIRLLWYRNGYMSDSINRVNDSTLSIAQWFDDGSPAASGHLVNERRQGKWLFLHRNGKRAALIDYNKDKAIIQVYYNEDGSQQPDSVAANHEAVFNKKGEEGWRTYLANNTTWPKGYKLTNTNRVSVTIQFCVDEDGKIKDAEVLLPFDPVFDKEALRIIQQSPAWLPEIRQNRKVKTWRRQPITFLQQE